MFGRLASAFPLLALAAAAPPAREEFAARSRIDGHVLAGEIDRPAGSSRAVVVMFPGSGTHTRDAPSSVRGAPRAFVFRDLSARLVTAGFVTVRYDERGIGCRPGDRPDDIGRCFNDDDARHISWATLFSDAAAIWREATRVAAGGCVIALGHSEGVVHIGRLIASHVANPTGVVAISGAFRSLADTLPYQRIELVPRTLLAADADGDGLTTRAELDAAFPHSPLSRYGGPERLSWPKGWTWPDRGVTRADVAALRAAYAAEFAAYVQDTLRHRDDDADTITTPAGQTSVVASYGWSKIFVRPSPPVVRMFAGYRGRIAAFFGGIDGNIDALQEAAALRAGFPMQRLTVAVTADVGHMLGDNGSFGPMRVERQEAIVAAVRQLAARCRGPAQLSK